MERIALVGVYPPPIGGVSVHIKRLHQFLTNKGVYCVVYDVGAKRAKSEGVVPVSNGISLLGRLFLSKDLERNRTSILNLHSISFLLEKMRKV